VERRNRGLRKDHKAIDIVFCKVSRDSCKSRTEKDPKEDGIRDTEERKSPGGNFRS